MLMVMFTKGNGCMIKLMEVASMSTLMGLSTVVIGKKISRMDMVSKHGLTMPNMKEPMKMVRSMVSVPSIGQTNRFT